MGTAKAVGNYFANDLRHPSLTFQHCQEIASQTRDTAKLAEALQYGRTLNGLQYVSLRGCPEWAVAAALPAVRLPSPLPLAPAQSALERLT